MLDLFQAAGVTGSWAGVTEQQYVMLLDRLNPQELGGSPQKTHI